MPGNDCFRLTIISAERQSDQKRDSQTHRNRSAASNPRALPRRALENPDLMPECNNLELQCTASFQGG